jgi:hypothetical protein
MRSTVACDALAAATAPTAMPLPDFAAQDTATRASAATALVLASPFYGAAMDFGFGTPGSTTASLVLTPEQIACSSVQPLPPQGHHHRSTDSSRRRRFIQLGRHSPSSSAWPVRGCCRPMHCRIRKPMLDWIGTRPPMSPLRSGAHARPPLPSLPGLVAPRPVAPLLAREVEAAFTAINQGAHQSRGIAPSVVCCFAVSVPWRETRPRRCSAASLQRHRRRHRACWGHHA